MYQAHTTDLTAYKFYLQSFILRVAGLATEKGMEGCPVTDYWAFSSESQRSIHRVRESREPRPESTSGIQLCVQICVRIQW